jgi:transcriptional regulator with XRE-family HTH domain
MLIASVIIQAYNVFNNLKEKVSKISVFIVFIFETLLCRLVFYVMSHGQQENTGAKVDVKAERIKRNLSQQELADATGIERAQISRIEAGVVQPQAKTLFKIEQVFGLSNNKVEEKCSVEILESGEVFYYDCKVMQGWNGLIRSKCTSNRNAPHIKIGDITFFKKLGDDDCKRTASFDPDKNIIEGYYLVKFDTGSHCFYITQNIVSLNEINLIAANPDFPDLGIFKKQDLEVLGYLVHVGRNIVSPPSEFALYPLDN